MAFQKWIFLQLQFYVPIYGVCRLRQNGIFYPIFFSSNVCRSSPIPLDGNPKRFKVHHQLSMHYVFGVKLLFPSKVFCGTFPPSVCVFFILQAVLFRPKPILTLERPIRHTWVSRMHPSHHDSSIAVIVTMTHNQSGADCSVLQDPGCNLTYIRNFVPTVGILPYFYTVYPQPRSSCDGCLQHARTLFSHFKEVGVCVLFRFCAERSFSGWALLLW